MKIRLSHKAADKIYNNLKDLTEEDIIELDDIEYRVIEITEDEASMPGDNPFLDTIAYWQIIILRKFGDDDEYFKYERRTDCWRGCFGDNDDESYLIEVRPKEVTVIEYEEI